MPDKPDHLPLKIMGILAVIILIIAIADGIINNRTCQTIPSALLLLPVFALIFTYIYFTRIIHSKPLKPEIKTFEDVQHHWAITSVMMFFILILTAVMLRVPELWGCVFDPPSREVFYPQFVFTSLAFIISLFPMSENISLLKTQSGMGAVFWLVTSLTFFIGYTLDEGAVNVRFTLIAFALFFSIRFFGFFNKLKELSEQKRIREKMDAKRRRVGKKN